MPAVQLRQPGDREPDPRWADLYRIGGIACLTSVAIIVIAVAAYFIWGYAPGSKSTAEVFALVQTSRVGGIIALDLFLLLGVLVSLLVLLALYAALKQVNESYALIALALALLSTAAMISARPIADVVALSDKYAAAQVAAERAQYLAAGTALLSIFDGTSWMVSTALGALCVLIYSWLMLRSHVFSRATAYLGLVTGLCTCGFFIPVVGVILLFVSMFTTLFWNLLLARRFLQLSRQTVPAVLQMEA